MPWKRMKEWSYRSTQSLPPHYVEVGGQIHAPATLTAEKIYGTY